MQNPITESWRLKTYELDLEELQKLTIYDLRRADFNPDITALRTAYASVNAFYNAMLLKKTYYKEAKENIVPALKKISIALYGDPRSRQTLEVQAALGVWFATDNFNRQIMRNGQNILHKLWAIFKIVQFWGYDSGFFATKPRATKYGKTAIEDALNF